MAGVRRCAGRADGGFTLVEVMVALGIFTAVSLATTSILLVALKTVRENEDRVLAATIARSTIEQLRLSGSSTIKSGLTASTSQGFDVRVTANWVGVGQTGSACQAASPGRDFVRVNVQVSGRSLSKAQVVDGIIPADSTTTSTQSTTGSLAVSVGGVFAEPVSDVAVVGVDVNHPKNNFSLTTGADGCVFLTALEPTGTLVVTVSRTSGGLTYVARTPTGRTQQAQIAAGQGSRLSYELAAPASVRFDNADPTYVPPTGVPVAWKQLLTGASVTSTALGSTVSNMWPSTTAYQAWLGTCTDADPEPYGGKPTYFSLSAGNLTVARVTGAQADVTGLKPGNHLQLVYGGPDAACAGMILDAGAAPATGSMSVLLPFGTWDFRSGTDVVKPGVLRPSGGTATVAFHQNQPSPSPTPTGSSSASPAPSPT